MSSNYIAMLDASPELSALSASLPDVLQFMQVLWAVAHALARASKRMSGDLGVTGPQRLVLRVVGLFPGMSAGDLAGVLHVHPSTLTGVLQRLVEQRLVHRVHDPRDRRRAILHLTALGVRVNATRARTVEAAVDATLRTVNSLDRRATMRVLRQLAARLASQGRRNTAPAARRRARARRKVE